MSAWPYKKPKKQKRLLNLYKDSFEALCVLIVPKADRGFDWACI
jgi:hypothetical protein